MRVTDAAGNVNSASVTFIVSYGPTIIVSPGSPIYTNEDEVDITIEAPDYAPLTTGNSTHYVNGLLKGSSTINSLIAGQTAFSEVISFHLDVGTNLFVITVNDSAGNSMTFSITIVYDTTKPIINIVSPTDGSYNNTGSVTIVWEGDDEASGLAYYNLSVFNGATWDNTTYIDPSESSQVLTLGDGSYVVHVEAVDKAGNVNCVFGQLHCRYHGTNRRCRLAERWCLQHHWLGDGRLDRRRAERSRSLRGPIEQRGVDHRQR